MLNYTFLVVVNCLHQNRLLIKKKIFSYTKGLVYASVIDSFLFKTYCRCEEFNRVFFRNNDLTGQQSKINS